MDALWQDTNIFYNILCFLITENEKLFDRSDARLYWKTMAHIFIILHHACISVFARSLDLANHPVLIIRDLYTYKFGYLTGWNFSFQTIFLSLALVHDVLEWLNKHESSIGSKIRYVRDVMFTGLVVPFTCFVTGMFWSVYSIDRELVFPKVYDSIVPWWFNHCVHTNIAVVIIAEMILQPRRQPINKKLELSLGLSVAVFYAFVYYCIYFFAHRWLYGVFGIMTWWQVCLFQLFIWSSVVFFYLIQFPINRMIHGPEPEVTEVIEAKDQNGRDEKNIFHTESYEDRNGSAKNPDLLSAPFATKSWSLKYRLIREQFENSRL